MRREEYLDALEAELKRLTRGERKDVRREMAGHIEDHVETLLALGCTEDEADGRATAAMGDPVETGRAISKLYHPFWLWLQGAATIIIVFMTIWSLLGLGMLGGAWSSVSARFCAPDDKEAVRLNDRMAVGDDVVRVYGARSYYTPEGGGVELWLCAYDRAPFGCVNQGIWQWVEIGAEGDAPKQERGIFRDGHSNEGATYRRDLLPLAEGDTRVTLCYERFGKVVEHTVDLSEVMG